MWRRGPRVEASLLICWAAEHGCLSSCLSTCWLAGWCTQWRCLRPLFPPPASKQLYFSTPKLREQLNLVPSHCSPILHHSMCTHTHTGFLLPGSLVGCGASVVASVCSKKKKTQKCCILKFELTTECDSLSYPDQHRCEAQTWTNITECSFLILTKINLTLFESHDINTNTMIEIYNLVIWSMWEQLYYYYYLSFCTTRCHIHLFNLFFLVIVLTYQSI